MTFEEIGNLYSIGNIVVMILTLVGFAVTVAVALLLRPANRGAWILAGAFLLDFLSSVALLVMNLAQDRWSEWASAREILQVASLLTEVVAGLGLLLGLALIAPARKQLVQREAPHV